MDQQKNIVTIALCGLLFLGCQKESQTAVDVPNTPATATTSAPIAEVPIAESVPQSAPSAPLAVAPVASVSTPVVETPPASAAPVLSAPATMLADNSALPVTAPAPATTVLDMCGLARHSVQPNQAEILRVNRGLIRKTAVEAVVSDANPIVFSGNGRGATVREADNLALRDLQSSIGEAIRNTPNLCSTYVGGMLSMCRSANSALALQDEIALAGIKYERSQTSDGEKVTEAKISNIDSLKIYEQKAEEERKQLDELLAALDVSGANNEHDTKNNIAIHMYRYMNIAAVAAALGQSSYLKRTQAFDKMLGVVAQFQTANSLDEAATKIASAVTQNGVRIYPARQYNALEITPFAAALYDKLQVKLNKRAIKDNSGEFSLAGTYKVCDNGDIVLNYELLTRDSLVANRVSLLVNKDVYASFRAQPLASDFDQTIAQKTAVVDGFRSEITTNIGNKDLLLRDGESVHFYARLTQAGYFYVIGHVVYQNKQKFSYLLDVNEGSGAEKFVYFVPPDKVNQYIDLGEYTMGAPFGTEYLQLIASSDNPTKNLPPVRWDEKLELSVLDTSMGAPKEVVERVRAAKKAKKNLSARSHESILSYTTRP